jgi:hypothetical protein
MAHQEKGGWTQVDPGMPEATWDSQRPKDSKDIKLLSENLNIFTWALKDT